MGKIIKGKVKWYNGIRGYGFIETEDGADAFVHKSGLRDSFSDLESGQEVEFETEVTDKGLSAFNVKSI